MSDDTNPSIAIDNPASTLLSTSNKPRPIPLALKLIRLAFRLGGHLVSGHVDGLGIVTAIAEDARSIRYTVKVPKELKKYIAVKGSICIDGTSLTVNAVNNDNFEINIVPHTQERTIIKSYKVGTEVNLEVDLVARYIESLLMHHSESNDESINFEMLAKAGFTHKI